MMHERRQARLTRPFQPREYTYTFDIREDTRPAPVDEIEVQAMDIEEAYQKARKQLKPGQRCQLQ